MSRQRLAPVYIAIAVTIVIIAARYTSMAGVEAVDVRTHQHR